MATAIPISLSIDLQGLKLVPFQGSVGTLPNFYQGNIKDISVIGLQPTGSDFGAAWTQANLVGYTMEVTISATPKGDGSQVLYMAPVALTSSGTVATLFTGQLDFTQSNLQTAMGSLSQIPATIEFEIILAGVRQTVYQDTITIFAPADNGGSVTPSPATSYYTAAQVNAQFVKIQGSPGTGFYLVSPDGTKNMFISLGNDGTLQQQLF